MGYRTIQHKITALSQFAGVAPGGVLTHADEMDKYAANANGGLFDFAQTTAVRPKHFAFKGGGQATWKLELVDAEGNVYPLENGTNEAAVFKKLDYLVLLKGQKLKLTTTGATTAQVAWITMSTRASG
jgi:hypothetical protein